MASSAKADLQSRAGNPDFLEERGTLSSFVVFLVAGLAIFLFALSPVTARISVRQLDGMKSWPHSHRWHRPLGSYRFLL